MVNALEKASKKERLIEFIFTPCITGDLIMRNTFNFSRIKDHPNDIESFEVDAEALVNSVYVGPQGDLLEKINNFNRTYDVDLEVTKQFTLKPGGYDKMKKAYSNYVLRWDMKPRGIESIFKRIHEYGWRFSSFKRDAIDLDGKMMDLRSRGLRWQDNTEDFNIELTKLKSTIISALETCKTLYPNVEITVKILPTKRRGNFSHNYRSAGRYSFPELVTTETNEYILAFYLHIKKPTMTVHILQSNEDIEQFSVECEDIICVTGTYLLPIISRNWGRNTLRNDVGSNTREQLFLEALYLSPMGCSFHPYIQGTQDKYSFELEPDQNCYSHVCLGNMTNEIKSTLLNAQIEAHFTYIVNWLTNYYIPQTNPLHRINAIHHVGSNRDFVSLADRNDAFNVSTDRDSCNLHHKMSVSIVEYAKKSRADTPYNHNRFLVSQGSTEYKERLEQYIDNIKEEDLPCNKCLYTNDCSQETNIRMYLSRTLLEPMEEAYLGMYHEMNHLLRFNIGHDIGDRLHYFIEESLFYANRYKIDEEYEKFLQSCRIANLAINDDEERTWGLNRWTDVAKIAHRKSDAVKNALEQLGTKLIGWDTCEIDDFSNADITDRNLQEIHEEINVAFDIPTEEEIEDMSNPTLDEIVSPEERTLRWASTQGGATNL